MKSQQDGDFQKLHRTEWGNFLWERLSEKLAATRHKEEVGGIINALFSEYEKSIITKRIAAVVLIRAGVASREIGRILWMSLATISALRKNIFSKLSAYKSQRSFRSAIKRKSSAPLIKNEQSWLDLLNGIDIIELLKNPPRPRGIGLKR